MPVLSGEEGLKFARKIWKMITGGPGFDRIMHKVNIISAGNGCCTAEVLVEKDITNRMDILHGGCTASLVDVISTMGLMTIEQTKPGISVNISVNYQSAAKLGQMVQIDTKTLKVGRKLAYLDVVMTEKESGKLLATGTHIKYMGD